MKCISGSLSIICDSSGNLSVICFKVILAEKTRREKVRFNKYYFENYSSDTPFDINNPRFVMAMDGVDSVLERIVTSAPYSLTTGDFDHAELLNALLNIDVLQIKDDHLGIAVPFFLSRDADVLKELSKKVANIIAAELLARKERIADIISQIDNGFPAERNLYHILCAYIFG